VTIKDITVYNDFGFKESEILNECVVAHPIILSPFSPSVHYDKLKPSYLCQDGVYPYLQGIMCAHLKGS